MWLAPRGDYASRVRRFALLFLCAFAVSLAFALPSVSFIPPTLNDSSTTGFNWVFVNLTSTEPLNQSLLEWGNQSSYFNFSMLNSSQTNWFLNVSNLTDGAYNYTILAQNTAGNWNQTNRRFIVVDTTQPSLAFVYPTPDSGSITSNNWVYVNTTITDASNTTALIDWNRSLVGWWRFNEGGGTTAHDFSGWGNNGTLKNGSATCANGDCPAWISGKFGYGLRFDGTDDYVTVGNSSKLSFMNYFTFELWVSSFGSLQVYNGLISKKYFGDNGDYYLEISSGGSLRLTLQNVTGVDYTVSSNALTWDNGVFYHVSATYSNGTVTLYRNGVVIKTGYIAPPLITSTRPVYIGSAKTNDYVFNGIIDEVRIYNRALSPEEINASYNAGSHRLYHNVTGLTDGAYNYTAYAQDLAGNVNQTETRSVLVAIPPQISFVWPTWANNSDRAEGWEYVNVTLSETGSVSLLEWDNGSVENYTMQGSGTNFYLNMAGQNGTITYRVYANDTSGNMGVSEIRVVVLNYTGSDVTPPSFLILSPANDTYEAGYLWTDILLDEPGGWCGLSLNGAPNQTMLNTSATAWQLNIYASSIGSNNITFSCNDTTGNLGKSTVYFTVADTIRPNVTAWSTNATNAASSTDTMFLVGINDSVLFNVTVVDNTTLDYQWLVNKADQNQNANNFTFSVPSCDHVNDLSSCIWEIHLIVNDSAGNEAHKEWVVSNLTLNESPIFFEPFTDGKYNSRVDTDPWGRSLTNWTYRSGGDFSKMMFEGFGTLRENLGITYGTWIFYKRFPHGVNISNEEGVQFSQYETYSSERYDLRQVSDGHFWYDLWRNGTRYVIMNYGMSAGMNSLGFFNDNNWHKIMLIREPSGETYIYIDDVQYPRGRSRIDNLTISQIEFQAESGVDGVTDQIDAIQVYNRTYLFPPKNVIYNASSNTILLSNGVKDPITLEYINRSIHNSSVFTYYPNKTAYSYANILLTRGTNLLVEDETLYIYEPSNNYLSFIADDDSAPDALAAACMCTITLVNSTVSSTDTNNNVNTKLYGVFLNIHNSTVTKLSGSTWRIFGGALDHATFNGSGGGWEWDYSATTYDMSLNEVIVNGDLDLENSEFVWRDSSASSLWGRFSRTYNLINVNGSWNSNLYVSGYSTWIRSWYPDLYVGDASFSPLGNITLVVFNEVNDSSNPPRNRIENEPGLRYGIGQTMGTSHLIKSIPGVIMRETTTNSSGHAPLPSDKQLALVLDDYSIKFISGNQTNYTYTISAFDPSSIWTNVTHTIYPNGTILQLQPLAQLTGINPDESWYRPDPKVPTYTVNLTINYTRTNLSVNAGLNATNITVTKWNTSLSQGQVLVNFTAESVNGNNVNFTVCNLTAMRTYAIKKDGSSFASKVADSSGCIWFNTSVWTAHVFTVEEQFQGPSGCSAIGGAIYNVSTNTIILNSGQTSTLCTLYYDVNNQSALSYELSTNTYTLNANNMTIYGGATLIIENTTLKLNATYENQVMLTVGKLWSGNGTLIVENSTIGSVNSTLRASILATKQTGTDGPTSITNSMINSVYQITSTSFNPVGALIKINNSILNNTHAINTPYWISNSIIQNSDADNNNGAMYGYAVNVTMRNNLNQQSFGIHYAHEVARSSVYDLNITNTNVAIYAKEQSASGYFRDNRVWNIVGGGHGLDVQLSNDNTYLDSNPFVIANNTVFNVSGNGITVAGRPFANVLSNNVTYSYTGLYIWGVEEGGYSFKNNLTSKNNRYTNNIKGIVYAGDSWPNVTILSINDDFSGSTQYDIQLGGTLYTPKFINAKYNLSKTSLTGRLYDYKYLDVKVFDTSGSPVNNALLNIINLNDTIYSSIDITGANKTSVATGISGHTLLPDENESSSLAVMAFWKNSTHQQNMSYAISAYDPLNIWISVTHTIYPNGTIQQLQPLAQVTNITPDESWYRPDPNVPTHTVNLTINYTRTNITVNANQNATNITVTKWNTSLSAGNIIVNFTAESINGNNVNFTVCSMAASTNYTIKKDGSAFATKTSDSSGCVWFNNSAWTSHVFTLAEETTPVEYIIGNLLVANETSWTNRHVILTGNLSIVSGGVLSLLNGTILEMNVSSDLQYEIRLNGTGKLVVNDSTITSFAKNWSYDSTKNSRIHLASGSPMIQADNATFSYLGSVHAAFRQDGAITMEASGTDSYVKNSVFQYVISAASVLSGTHLDITGTRFFNVGSDIPMGQGHAIYGVYYYYPSVQTTYFKDNYFDTIVGYVDAQPTNIDTMSNVAYDNVTIYNLTSSAVHHINFYGNIKNMTMNNIHQDGGKGITFNNPSNAWLSANITMENITWSNSIGSVLTWTLMYSDFAARKISATNGGLFLTTCVGSDYCLWRSEVSDVVWTGIGIQGGLIRVVMRDSHWSNFNINGTAGNSMFWFQDIQSASYPTIQSKNNVLENFTFDGTHGANGGYDAAVVVSYASNNSFVDWAILMDDGYDIYVAANATNNRWINVFENLVGVALGSSYEKYQYLDVFVKDANGDSLGGVALAVVNDVNVSFPSLNRGGVEKTTFVTTADGHTPKPIGNDSETAVVLDYLLTASYQQNMTYTISAFDLNHIWISVTHTIYPNGTIQQLQPLAHVTGVNPDASWYRPNPNSYQNTTVLQINYSRTNMSVNAGLNATNITVTKWNTSLPQGQILVNFTAESVDGNSVNFTVCSLAAMQNYSIKRDGSAFATKTSDSSGCVWFNNSAWTSHVFTLEEQSQGPSGCSAIGAATYAAEANTIISNQSSTLCTLYYDVFNESILAYTQSTHTYTLNAKINITNGASFAIENTTLLMNGSADDSLTIDVGWNLTINNATIKSSAAGKRFLIWAGTQTNGGHAHYLNDVTIENGYFRIDSRVPEYLQGPPRYPYIRILNFRMRNLNMTGATLPSGYDSVSAFYVNNAVNSTFWGISLENVTGGNTQYGQTFAIGGINATLKNLNLINSWNYNAGSSASFGVSEGVSYDNITIEDVRGGYAAIFGKEVWTNKIITFTNIVIRNVTKTGSNFAGITTYLNMPQFACIVPCGLNIENYYFDGAPLRGTGFATYAITHTYDLPISVWIFNASLHNMAATFGAINNNTLHITNVYTDSPIWDIYTQPYTNGTINWYELIDVKVIGNTGNPISGATITLTSNQTAPLPVLVDKSWNDKTFLTTGSDGHTPLPSNKTGMGAVLRIRYHDSDSQWGGTVNATTYSYSVSAFDPANIWTNVTHTIYPNGTILQLQPLAQASNVTPDTSWYRPNPNSYQNTTVLQINYTRTNITVNAGLNATNITVTKWNVSDSGIKVNFTAESVNGNNVNFTVCSLTATKNYAIKKDGSALSTKTADSSGCVWFNNSAWTSHAFTLEEQGQGPSGCTAINAAFYNASSNTIVLNNQTSTLCTIYYDVNDVSVLSYVPGLNEYSANAILFVKANANLTVNGTTLKFNNLFEGEYFLENNGYLEIANSTLMTTNPDYKSYVVNVRGYEYGASVSWAFSMVNGTLKYMGSNELYKNALELGEAVSDTSNRPRSPVIVKDSIIRDAESGFLYFDEFSGKNDLIVANNEFFGLNTTKTGNAGTIVLNGHGVNFSNNKVYNVTGIGSAAILLVQGYNDTVIANNEFYAVAGGGAIKSKHSQNVTIRNNYLHDSVGVAISLYKGSGVIPGYELGDLFENNLVENYDYAGGYVMEVLHYSRTGNVLQNNTFRNIAGNFLRMNGVNDNIFENNTIQNVTGSAIVVSSTTYGVYMYNHNLTFRNNQYRQVSGKVLVVGSDKVNQSSISVDEIYYNNSGDPWDIRLSYSFEPGFVNLKRSREPLYLDPGAYFYDFKYLDVNVTDSIGHPINGATVTTSNSVNSSYPPINILGHVKTSAISGVDGHTPLPHSQSDSIAILDFWKTSTEQQNMSYSISAFDPAHIWTNVTHTIYPNGTILQLQPLAQATNVTPDESWYRPDPNVPTYTVNLTISYARTNLSFAVTDVANIAVFEYSSAKINFSAVNSTTSQKMNVSVSNGTFPVFTGYPYTLRRDGLLQSTQIASAGRVVFANIWVGGGYIIELFTNLAVSLNSPPDNLLTNNPAVVFNCSAFSNNSLVNISLFGNFSGVFALNGSVVVSGSVNSTSFARVLPDGSYAWNCLAFDFGGFLFAQDNFSLTVDTVPPASITGLGNQSQSNDWIFWSWTNPSSDFGHTEVYLNGVWVANTSNSFYNATGLNASSWYRLSVRAVDAAGNVNLSWVNSSARTLPDTTPPAILILLPGNTTYNYNQSLPLNFSVSEVASWCGYSLDGGVNVTIASCLNSTFDVSGSGQHSIRVFANDSAGNVGSSVVFFVVDVLAPVLSNISASVTVDSAVVTWDSDEPANSSVFYWAGLNPVLGVANGSFVVHHSVSLGGLSSSTQYYYNVSSCDVVGNCNVSVQYSFSTSAGSTAASGSPSGGGSSPGLASTGAKFLVLSLPFVRVAVAFRGELSNPSLVVAIPASVPVPVSSGIVYQYLNFTKIGFNDSDVLNATIEFQVNKSWISAENIAHVHLARFSNGWAVLRTERVNSTGLHNTYRAYAKGFSYFAIVGEEAASLPVLEKNDVTEVQILLPSNESLHEGGGLVNRSGLENVVVAAVPVDKSGVLTILLALLALALGGYARYSRVPC